MKTLHLSIVFGSGIAAVVAVGIYMLIFPISITSNYANPSCNPTPNISRDEITLKKITSLSVMEIEKNQAKLDCTSLTNETLSNLPKLEQELNGADQCKQGQDNVCSFPSGIGITIVSDGIMPVEEGKNYQASLTQDEAHFLLDNVNLGQVGSLVAGDVNYDGKYYQVLLYTNDGSLTPQVSASYATEPGMSNMSTGKSVNYTITVQTLATFGRPAHVQLYPTVSAQDSGLTAKIIPNVLSIPERSKANATLVITAGPNTQNGKYQIGFYGKIDGSKLSMNHEYCPCLRVGDSDWDIATHGGGSNGGYGGNQPPQWLRVETVTDKKVYHSGDVVEIENFIINDSPNTVTLENNVGLIINIYNQVNGTGPSRYFYNLAALYEGKALSLEPHSKTLIARPIYWAQEDLRAEPFSDKVTPGDYHIDASFRGYNGTFWDNDFSITIK
ncbi:MAG: hypothetical protein KGH87_00955 [Thaumarchaeota archaeon]|nr:hypothetical protein [Nitrososphaerota archaeon]MDE1838464.1 hypothetical protein [Nitrososphaerota archaeon]